MVNLDMRSVGLKLDEVIEAGFPRVDNLPSCPKIAIQPCVSPDREGFAIVCGRHRDGVEIDDWGAIPPGVMTSEVHLERKVWAYRHPRTGETCSWHVWVGQCPDCGAIYHAFLER